MARYPKAMWNPSPNMTTGGMLDWHLFAFHIEQGTEAGTISWFSQGRSQVSAHFSIGKDGAVHQHVDTKDKAWAEANGNPHTISCEFEGMSGDSLSPAQLASAGALLAWCHTVHGVVLVVTDNPLGKGVIGHSLGGVAWGNHPNCPGYPILGQRQKVVDRALALTAPVSLPKPLAGASGTPTNPTWFHRILSLRSPFMSGSDVTRAQTRLGTRADGLFGPDTRNQVVSFQHRHGLTPDGVIGPLTARKLG